MDGVRDNALHCADCLQSAFKSRAVAQTKKIRAFRFVFYCFGAVTETWTRTGSPYAPQTYASAYSAMTAHSLLIIWFIAFVVKDFFKTKWANITNCKNRLPTYANMHEWAYSQIGAQGSVEDLKKLNLFQEVFFWGVLRDIASEYDCKRVHLLRCFTNAF